MNDGKELKGLQEDERNQKRSVAEALADLASLYDERNALYKDNYKRFGPALFTLMGPVQLNNAHEFNRFAILVQVFAKVSRYVQMFNEGGHNDSLDDLSVYAQMLQELDRMDPAQLQLFN